MSSKVQINEMRLRVPSSYGQDARRLAETVAARLHEKQVVGRRYSEFIPSIKTRVQSEARSSVERLADEIVFSLQRSL